ncbi:MAG: beta-galactosidase [Clostridia bacterium]|nr:beta-galactosidase [Clostridia bacterium]
MYIYNPADLPVHLEPADGCISFGIRLDDGFFNYNWFVPELRADGGDETDITLEWFCGEGEPTRVRMTQKLIPRCRAKLPFPITPERFLLNGCFLPPYSALRKGSCGGKPTDKQLLRWVKITIRSSELSSVTLWGVEYTAERPAVVLEGEPLLDRFGQAIHGEWENKVHSEEELVSYLRGEYERSKDGGSYPDGWSKWGGWMAKKFDATGWFHLAHDGRRHWLADPDGCAFFSNGICYGERAGIFSFTGDYANLHEWLPDEDGVYADAWSDASNIPQYVVRNGLAGASERKMFNFSRANLIRAFGDRWHEAYTTITAARLHKMGFNTIGVGTNDYFNERTREFLNGAKIPYVVTFRTFPLTSERIFRDFPDVFGDEYRALCREFARRELTPYIDDPYLIGYFVTNEPEWLFASNVNLAERLLASAGCRASKERFIGRLREKYADIAALNDAWGTDFVSFDDLLGANPDLYGRNAACDADLDAFERELVEGYGQIVSEELHRVDDHHLNLGMRYAGLAEKTLRFNLDYFDAFSINCYGPTPIDRAQKVTKFHDIPIISGEWHIGALESGLPAPGLWYCDTQKERAMGCRYYMESAAQNANIVGIHYFEYNDQPWFGRFDGECYQIGLSDVCHKPYRAVCDMFADFAGRMYPMLNGDIPMTAEPIEIKKY